MERGQPLVALLAGTQPEQPDRQCLPGSLPVQGGSCRRGYRALAFYGFPDTYYFLDEYTRFPAMDEVFLEYVRNVVKRRRNKKQVLLVNDLYANENTISSSITFNDPALVMIDGVPIEELPFLWAFDPLLVEKIDIVQRINYVGDQSFPGLVNLSTYRHDFGGQPFPDYLVVKEFQGLQEEKRFFAPDYDAAATHNTRLPDFRNLLYWNPDIRLTAGKPEALEFFASDRPGQYLIEVNGITTAGIPLYGRTLIQVK